MIYLYTMWKKLDNGQIHPNLSGETIMKHYFTQD